MRRNYASGFFRDMGFRGRISRKSCCEKKCSITTPSARSNGGPLPFLDERPVLEIAVRLLQFLVRIHHDRLGPDAGRSIASAARDAAVDAPGSAS